MRITAIDIRDFPPIRAFAVSNIADVVVLGGPNGVGKTRLLEALLAKFRNPVDHSNIHVCVEATTAEEKTAWGGRATLDTRIAVEANVLRGFLQRAKKRGRLRSGVLNFDSSRAFEQVKPYSFSWDFRDPFEEEIGWDFALIPLRNRFTDTIHSLHRKLRSQKEQIARQALQLHRSGERSMPLDFPDPLEKFKKAFAKLLPGKRLLELDERMQNIRYSTGTSEGAPILQLNSLSSGEREVVGVVFDFLLRDPEDCVVVFDEPELHLHPELSYRLLRTLRESGERNQFFFCTHSADIISASLEHTVVFISPTAEGKNQAIVLEEESEASRVLHLLGQSIGVISLGQRIVLVEGEKTSLDKQTYGAIVGDDHSDLVLVPAGGRDALETFASALDTVLNRAIWGVDFFVLCDGDASVTPATMAQLQQRTGGRLRRLPRYHLENYFLDGNVLATVFHRLHDAEDSWLCDAERIEECLRELAAPLISYAAALRVAHRVRMRVGNVDIMPKACDHENLEGLRTVFQQKATEEQRRLQDVLDSESLNALVEREYRLIKDAVQNGTPDWKALVPGRPVLGKFAQRSKMDVTRLKTLYIKAATDCSPDPFEEIREIFRAFAAFG